MPPKVTELIVWYLPGRIKELTRKGKYLNTWPYDAAKLNMLLDVLQSPLFLHLLHPLRGYAAEVEKAAKETIYKCNQSAAFTRCFITKIQDSVHDQLKILQSKLGKGKSSTRAHTALDKLQH